MGPGSLHLEKNQRTPQKLCSPIESDPLDPDPNQIEGNATIYKFRSPLLLENT